MLWDFCFVVSLYLYILFIICVPSSWEAIVWGEITNTWHNDLVPTGTDNISLISHYCVIDNNNEARSRDKARGKMQQWTLNTNPELPWLKSAVKWKSQLVMMGFNSTNKLTDNRLIGSELFSSTDIPLSPSHHSAALSDCWIDLSSSCSNLQSLKSVSPGLKCIMHPSSG